MARVEVTFSGQSRGAVEAAKATANALKDVRKQAGESSVHLGHHSRALGEGTKELGRFTRGAAAGSGVLSHFGRSVAFASSAFLGAAGFTAVIKQSIGAASDLHEQINKTDVVFGKSAGIVKQWSKDSATAMGIASAEALGMAATFGNLLHPMGFARDEAAKMSTRLVQLSSDMASFNNASPEATLAALQSGLAGQVRPLRQFGVFLDQSRIKAVALADGIAKPTVETRKLTEAQAAFAIAQDKVTQAIAKHGPKSREAAAAQLTLAKASDAVSKAMAGHVAPLTAAQKALATYQIILKDTQDAQGDFHRTSGGLANQTRILKAELTNLEEELGTALLPTINKYLPHVTRWLALNEKNGTFQRDFNKAVKIGGEIVDGVIPVIKNIVALFQGFSKAVGGSKHAIEILGAAFVGVKFGGAIITATKYVKELRLALLALGSEEVLAALGPVGLAVAGIAAGAAIGIAAGSQVPGTSGSMAVPAARVAAQRKRHPKAPIATSVDWDTKGNYQITWQDPQTGATRVENATPQQAAKVLGISVAALNKRSGLGPSPDTGFRGASIPAGTPSQIARSAAAKPGASAAGFHLEGERKPYDCSAFTQAVFKQAGLSIGGDTYSQFGKGRKVEKNDLQADDLVFFNYPGERSPGHVGIYVGGGMMVHDHGSSRGVSYQPVDWSAYVGARCYIAGHVHAAKTTVVDPATTQTGGATFTEKPKPTKPHTLVGSKLLSADVRVALAQADTPAERRKALVEARTELEKLQKTASKAERVPIAEELGRINKQIRAIDVAAVKAKLAEIAKTYQHAAQVAKKAIADQKAAWDKHVRDLQQTADATKQVLETKWAAAGDAAMAGFDKATSAGMAKIQKTFAAQMSAFDKETQAGLSALAAPAQTPTEKLLAERSAAKQVADDLQSVADAQKAVADAKQAIADQTRTVTGDVSAGTTTWTPPLDPNTSPEQAAASMQQLQDTLVAAQKQLSDALYQQQTDDLQTQADAERKAADDSAQQAQDAYQAQRDALRASLDEEEQVREDAYTTQRETERDNLQKWLDFELSQLEAGKLQWSTFYEQLSAMATAGGWDVGAAFWGAWIDAKNAAGPAIDAATAAAAGAGANTVQGLFGAGENNDPGAALQMAHDLAVTGAISPATYYYLTQGHKLNLPEFAGGGWIGGTSRPTTIRPRDTVLLRGSPGEYVMSHDEVAAGGPRWGSSGAVHVHFHGDVYDTRRAAEDAMAQLAQPGLRRLGSPIVMGR